MPATLLDVKTNFSFQGCTIRAHEWHNLVCTDQEDEGTNPAALPRKIFRFAGAFLMLEGQNPPALMNSKLKLYSGRYRLLAGSKS